MTSSSPSHSTSKITISIIGIILLVLAIFFFLSSSNTIVASSPKNCDCSSKSNNENSQDSMKIEDTSGSNSVISSPLMKEKCLTYKQRYSLCSQLLDKHTPQQRKLFFSQFLRSDPVKVSPPEVALYRLHRMKWSRDFWLNICSWVTESTGLPIIPLQEVVAAENSVQKQFELFTRKYPVLPGQKARDSFLFTLGGHEDSVPEEFQGFVRIHLEEELPKIFFAPLKGRSLYRGGYTHGGDLGAGLFLKVNPQYDFCWIFESDTRFGGTSWHRFLTMAREGAKEGVDHTPTLPENGKSGIGKEAHLIWFYPRLLNYGYGVPYEYSGVEDPERPRTKKPVVTPAYRRLEKQYWNDAINQKPVPEDPSKIINTHLLNFRPEYYGNWTRILANKVFNGAFVPACGFSRKLAMKVWELGLRGEGHFNQELMLPITAQLNGLKMTSLVGLSIPEKFTPTTTGSTRKKQKFFPFQFYFGFLNRNDTSPMYAAWHDGEEISDVATLYNGIHTFQFSGSKCMRDVLMHPVKY